MQCAPAVQVLALVLQKQWNPIAGKLCKTELHYKISACEVKVLCRNLDCISGHLRICTLLLKLTYLALVEITLRLVYSITLERRKRQLY